MSTSVASLQEKSPSHGSFDVSGCTVDEIGAHADPNHELSKNRAEPSRSGRKPIPSEEAPVWLSEQGWCDVYASPAVLANGISSPLEYLTLFQMHQSRTACNPWLKLLETELAKLVSALGFQQIEDGLENLDKKLGNVEQAAETLREKEVKRSEQQPQRSLSDSITSCCAVKNTQLEHILSFLISTSEKFQSFVKVTKEALLDEDRKNTLFKQCAGDKRLHLEVLDSGFELNSELLDILNRMESALTHFARFSTELLPFLSEHLSVTKKLSSAIDGAFENFMLIKDIEKTKKHSEEMVQIMGSLEHQYNILKTKFEQLSTFDEGHSRESRENVPNNQQMESLSNQKLENGIRNVSSAIPEAGNFFT
ncbi:uncharacterized protein LOC112349174 [Selaginella moellendorffii]|uniref:uncharacterized protein LOC112349174 n=1 Tax=Selaginella moellendorffii TaxID=88036 RepID=UPI000D1CA59A|nr:uncharacterized protein LOC112349174 [Selaginella moellendorffii]|eukprot:XP_024538835.1 uncharacterized protein LOC112349174 [Selaginella moellendorffii]